MELKRVSKFMMPILVVLSVIIDLFCDKTRSYGRSKIFPRAKSEEFFMDDGCVTPMGQMFYSPVYCYGYSDYIWLLYEKGQFH